MTIEDNIKEIMLQIAENTEVQYINNNTKIFTEESFIYTHTGSDKFGCFLYCGEIKV
ncbi:hypothetical protein SAMN05444143_11354 [Flavobacterium succinicans]|jgi:hypothetical protein|uniref:Uncharacterized protein n=1 Tax=Flavobacterium succinicans TaxID=29536 RepID=A0A1I4Z2J7_9FLAO|nr:hypothetical protein SAMN05444143_11354 [Flavobacterium succinicans]